MATPDDTQRVSVSRDALRADLAEMELRLQNFITAQLAGKADRGELVALTAAITELQLARQARDRGEFTDAQKREIDARAAAVDAGNADKAWSWKERMLAVLSALVTVATLILSVVLALHGGL